MDDVLTAPRGDVEVRTTSLVPDGARPGLRELCDDPRAFTQPVLSRGIWRDAAFGMQRRVRRARGPTHNPQLNVRRAPLQQSTQFGRLSPPPPPPPAAR